MTEPLWQDPFPLAGDETPYRNLDDGHVSVASFEGHEILKVDPEALALVAREAMRDVSFLMRPGHLRQVAAILDDPEASDNDRGVALAMLRNAEESAHMVLPFCQDTGTAGNARRARCDRRARREYITRGIWDLGRPPLLPDTAALPVGEEPAPTCQPRSTSTP
jgi:fumarate hydratase class I